MTMTTKTTKAILFSALILSVVITTVGLNTVWAGNGIDIQTTNELERDSTQSSQDSVEYFESVKPQPISNASYQEAKNIILSDDSIKKRISDKEFELMKKVGYIGNTDVLPIQWNPVLTIITDDEVITAEVDLNEKHLVNTAATKKHQLTLGGGDRSFATDYYDGSYTINGIEMNTYDTPDFTGSSGNEFTALLLNALMTGSTEADACDDENIPESFWAQTGFVFESNGWHLTVTDTSYNCLDRVITFNLSEDDNLRFRHYVNSNGDWTTWMKNLDTGLTYSETLTNLDGTTFVTDNLNTSVFFENANSNTTWDTQFGSDLTINTTYVRKSSDSNWYSWDSDAQNILDCDGFSHTDNVISGNLDFASSATWDLSVMADDWPGQNC